MQMRTTRPARLIGEYGFRLLMRLVSLVGWEGHVVCRRWLRPPISVVLGSGNNVVAEITRMKPSQEAGVEQDAAECDTMSALR